MSAYGPLEGLSTGVMIASGEAMVFDHIKTPGPMWTGQGKRWAEAPIVFERLFDAPPHVMLSIRMIDAIHMTNLRLQLIPKSVSRVGFTVSAHTWDDTKIGRLSISWLAIGERAVEWDV